MSHDLNIPKFSDEDRINAFGHLECIVQGRDLIHKLSPVPEICIHFHEGVYTLALPDTLADYTLHFLLIKDIAPTHLSLSALLNIIGRGPFLLRNTYPRNEHLHLEFNDSVVDYLSRSCRLPAIDLRLRLQAMETLLLYEPGREEIIRILVRTL